MDKPLLRKGVIAGADGCRGGWICVVTDLASGHLSATLYEKARDLILQQPRPRMLAIDIPIGLPERNARDCDRLARGRLGPRAASVFPAPIRPVMSAPSWEEANRLGKAIDGRGVSRQTWALGKKIREVDTVLSSSPALRTFVKEVHPELAFAEWNGGQPLAAAKKEARGASLRGALVASVFGRAVLRAVREAFPRGSVNSDDILDAFACLWTAERILSKRASRLPRNPPRDSTGLPMEIWY